MPGGPQRRAFGASKWDDEVSLRVGVDMGVPERSGEGGERVGRLWELSSWEELRAGGVSVAEWGVHRLCCEELRHRGREQLCCLLASLVSRRGIADTSEALTKLC